MKIWVIGNEKNELKDCAHLVASICRLRQAHELEYCFDPRLLKGSPWVLEALGIKRLSEDSLLSVPSKNLLEDRELLQTQELLGDDLPPSVTQAMSKKSEWLKAFERIVEKKSLRGWVAKPSIEDKDKRVLELLNHKVVPLGRADQSFPSETIDEHYKELLKIWSKLNNMMGVSMWNAQRGLIKNLDLYTQYKEKFPDSTEFGKISRLIRNSESQIESSVLKEELSEMEMQTLERETLEATAVKKRKKL